MKTKTIAIAIMMTTVLTALNCRAQILYADFSDPDVCEGTEDDYWLTASSFQCSPGLPVLHSTDLERWTLVNYALPRLKPYEHYDTLHHGCGVWAPSIRRHGDTYYIYYGYPDYGVYMVKTQNPAGRWDEPVLVLPGKGVIDTCPLWDDDGRVYLVNAWANSRCGFNSVLTVRELSADGTRAIGQPVMVYDGQPDGNHTIEGPKLYKKDGYYYILAPAGGVAGGWQVALRSRNIYGPYEMKTVYNQQGIHQGGWVNDAFICFQEVGAYGRILHRLDVSWKDVWPMMSRHKASKVHKIQCHDKAMLYQWHANYQDTFGFRTANGVRVYGHRVGMPAGKQTIWDVPNLYLKKFDGETFNDTLRTTITAKAEGQQSGFVIMGRDYLRLAVELHDGKFVVKEMRNTGADKGGAETTTILQTIAARNYGAGANPNYECSVTFAIECRPGALCNIAYSTDGKTFTQLPGQFKAREGVWIGAKYGVYSITPVASRGWIDLML